MPLGPSTSQELLMNVPVEKYVLKVILRISLVSKIYCIGYRTAPRQEFENSTFPDPPPLKFNGLRDRLKLYV